MVKLILPKINVTQLKYRLLENGVWPNAALFFALAYFVIFMSSLSTLTKPESLDDALQTVDQSAVATPEAAQMDFLLIKDWHLFGDPEAIAEEVQSQEGESQEGESQETDLPIRLMGVFFLPNQANSSYAIIENDDREQKKYHQGAELPGGVTLQSIAKEQVILLRNQQAEALSMAREKTGLLFITK